MASINRARYEVTLGDGWQRFSAPLRGSEMVGVIRVGDEEGALVHDGSGYLLVTPGRVMTLLNRKVAAAINSSIGKALDAA